MIWDAKCGNMNTRRITLMVLLLKIKKIIKWLIKKLLMESERTTGFKIITANRFLFMTGTAKNLLFTM